MTDHNDCRFFVYVDYTTEETPRPYYVGKGLKARVRNCRPRNKLYANIKDKYGFQRKDVFGPYLESEAFEEERRLIAELKTYYYGGSDHWGCNFTFGGDGSAGHHQPPITEEHRESIRKASSYPRSSSTKKKMSAAARRRANDPEWIEKMREVSKKRWESDEYRERIKNAVVGQKRTKEQCEKISEAQKESWKDPEKRKRLSETNKKRFTDLSERQRISDKLRELWKNSDYRQMMKEARNKRKHQENKNVE